MQGEEKLRRVGLSFHTVEFSEFLQLLSEILHVITADFAKKNLPLAKKHQCTRVVCIQDFFIERAYTLLGNRAFRAEISVKILRLIWFPFLPKVIERPEERFRRVPVNFQRLLVRPLLIPEPDKDEVFPVCAHPEHAIHRAVLFPPHGVEPAANLFDQLSVVGPVAIPRKRSRVFVFHYDVAIDRIRPSELVPMSRGNRDVVMTIKLDLGFPRKLLQGPRNLNLQVHLRLGPRRRLLNLIRQDHGPMPDNVVE